VNSYIAKAPCRIDLSGGTLDLWPLYLSQSDEFHVVNNMAINVYAYAELRTQRAQSFSLQIYSKDLKKKKTYKSLSQIKKALMKSSKEEPLRWLLRVFFHFWHKAGCPQKSFSLTSWSEIPPGSGLGGSSVMAVSVAKACLAVFDLRYTRWKLHSTLCNLETVEIEHPGGEQDSIPALFGGLLSFSQGIEEKKVFKHADLLAKNISKRILLAYTGKPHHSGINNWDVYKAFVEKDKRVQAALRKIAEVSKKMCISFEKNDTKTLAKLLKKEYESRKLLSPRIHIAEYDQIFKAAQNFQCQAMKACGAGGGGSLLLYFNNEKNKNLFYEAFSSQHHLIKIQVAPSARVKKL